MREEDYEGGEKSRVWFGARTNCLWLGDRRGEGEGRKCKICEEGEVEDLKHFILDCPALEGERQGERELQRPRRENEEKVMGRFLFGEEEGRSGRVETLVRMWRRRRRMEDEGSVIGYHTN